MYDVESIVERFNVQGVESASLIVCEGEFRLEEVPGIKIRFRVKRMICPEIPSGRYRFELSHWIQTPEQAGPYIPSAPYFDSVEIAVEHAVEFTIMNYYREAISKGYSPDASWLVPNSTW